MHVGAATGPAAERLHRRLAHIEVLIPHSPEQAVDGLSHLPDRGPEGQHCSLADFPCPVSKCGNGFGHEAGGAAKGGQRLQGGRPHPNVRIGSLLLQGPAGGGVADGGQALADRHPYEGVGISPETGNLLYRVEGDQAGHRQPANIGVGVCGSLGEHIEGAKAMLAEKADDSSAHRPVRGMGSLPEGSGERRISDDDFPELRQSSDGRGPDFGVVVAEGGGQARARLLRH